MRQHCDLCILLFLLLGLSAAPSLQSPSSPSSSSSPTAEEENGVGLGGGRRKESAQRRPLNEASEGRSSVDDDGIVAAEIVAESQPIVVSDTAELAPSIDPPVNVGLGPIVQHPYYPSHPTDARPGQQYQYYTSPYAAALGDRQPSEQPQLQQEQQQHHYHHSEIQHRPTLDDLSEEEAAIVTTPEQLLKHCCQFPACYDPLYELCIDTCRKCETVFPVTSWLPCPPLLNIPDCTSNSLSAAGRLPLACYPDIGPFANIMPISQVMRMSAPYNEPANRGVTPPDMAAQQEQSYRRSMREKNRKYCDNIGGNYGFGGGGGGGGGRVRGAGGICRSEKSSAAANRGRDAALLGQFWRR